MDLQRAQEILDSPERFAVTYQGAPVWLERVDQQNGSIHVHLEENPAEKKVIPAQELREQ